MDFNLSDMQQMLADSAGKFVADTYTLDHLRARRGMADGFDAGVWAQFAELGWLALPIPETAGGLGGSMADVAVLMTMLGRGAAVDPYVSSAVIGGHLISAAGSLAARDELLGAIASGEARVALAHGEADERYGDSPARTTRVTKLGNGLTLSGEKMLALDAPSATHLIVSATDDDGEMVLYLVAADAKGVTAEAYPLIDGAAAADFRFNLVGLTSEDCLAKGALAHRILAEASDRASVALSAQAVGSMEATLEICSAYLKERNQFGQPIGKFQALQHLMADMFVATHQSRSILYHALARIAADPNERAAAVSAARLIIGEASQLVSRSGIQLHGGYGITDEYLVSHHFRRLLSIEKQFGDVDYHTRRLADHAFGPIAA